MLLWVTYNLTLNGGRNTWTSGCTSELLPIVSPLTNMTLMVSVTLRYAFVVR